MDKPQWVSRFYEPASVIVVILSVLFFFGNRFFATPEDIIVLNKQIQDVKNDLSRVESDFKIEFAGVKSDINAITKEIKSVREGTESLQTGFNNVVLKIDESLKGSLIVETKIDDLSKRADRISNRVDKATTINPTINPKDD